MRNAKTDVRLCSSLLLADTQNTMPDELPVLGREMLALGNPEFADAQRPPVPEGGLPAALDRLDGDDGFVLNCLSNDAPTVESPPPRPSENRSVQHWLEENLEVGHGDAATYATALHEIGCESVDQLLEVEPKDLCDIFATKAEVRTFISKVHPHDRRIKTVLIELMPGMPKAKWVRWEQALKAEDIECEGDLLMISEEDFNLLNVGAVLRTALRRHRLKVLGHLRRRAQEANQQEGPRVCHISVRILTLRDIDMSANSFKAELIHDGSAL